MQGFFLLATQAQTLEPLSLSIKVLSVSGLCFLLIALPLACWLAWSKGPLREAIDILVTLPLVFPPVASGFVLLVLFGREGPFGGLFSGQIIFSFPGLVLAAFVAGLPLAIKPVQAALQSDEARKLADVAAVLGTTTPFIFFRVLLPCTKKSIAAGLLLATGRALGEVGMTLMLGGNIVGRTNTLSLEIYNAVFNGEFERAALLSCIVGAASICMFIALKKWSAI
ncbi:molybdate ABC transporter permease subunit [Desulfobaculum bizertense]|uniref:Molybdate transport system permease protein n=1 Tax=Desulfobaculum bizertense DSM 18034 TaxID=1121442 RepID=A0A1T4VPM7_9BACT|nr:ABC transporter permease subunit [Desulfobaculum bizertense]UIJ38204.1 ABC transporter permease subunit [Desulfobaculum bizertense]SKA66798.1 molybdate transport system permease protein [Desulfobaculum bizertense DSM 18034]